jgi:hypothetical protein
MKIKRKKGFLMKYRNLTYKVHKEKIIDQEKDLE